MIILPTKSYVRADMAFRQEFVRGVGHMDLAVGRNEGDIQQLE